MRDIQQDEFAWSKMLDQSPNKPNLEGYVRALFTSKNTLVDVIDRVCTALDLDAAYGVHLDYIGSIVGVTRSIPEGIFMAYFGFMSQPAGRAFNTVRMRRDGETITTAYTAGDAEYKTLIKLKIMMNNARGTEPEIVEAVRSVFNDPDLAVSVRQNGTAAAKIRIGRIPKPEDPTPQLLVDRTPRPGGVSYTFEYFRGDLEVDLLSGVLDSEATFTRSTIGTYIDGGGVLRYSAVNSPRFPVDTDTGLLQGLMQEPAATNLFTYSESFEHGSWGKFNSGFDDASQIGPDGLTSACFMTVLDTKASGNVSKIVAGLDATKTYTMTIFLKDHGWGKFCEDNGSLANFQVQLYEVGSPYIFKGGGQIYPKTMTLGTATGSNGATMTHRMRALADGWVRYELTTTLAGTPGASFQWRIILVQTGIQNLADGTTGVDIFGGMLEDRQNSSSYYPSYAGTQDTRGAETLTFAAVGKDWNNDDQGTMFIEFYEKSAVSGGVFNLMSLLKDSDEANRLRISYGALARLDAYIQNVSTQWDSNQNPISVNGISKAALSYSVSGAALFLNGSKRDQVAPYSRPRGFTSLSIGPGAMTRYLRKVSVLPRRLPDATLISQTTL